MPKNGNDDGSGWWLFDCIKIYDYDYDYCARKGWSKLNRNRNESNQIKNKIKLNLNEMNWNENDELISVDIVYGSECFTGIGFTFIYSLLVIGYVESARGNFFVFNLINSVWIGKIWIAS